jgi:hypothetical protein
MDNYNKYNSSRERTETSNAIIERLIKNMDFKTNSKSNYDLDIESEIPNLCDINCNNDILNDLKNSKNNFFKIFKPLDRILINPLIQILQPVFRHFNYKSDDVGFISLLAYIITLYWAYHQKEILMWIFLFFGSYCSFLDKIYYYKKCKNQYKKSCEMIKILIRIVSYIVMFIFMKSSYIFNVRKISDYVYLLIFMSIILIITEHHTSVIVYKLNAKHPKVKILRNKLNLIKIFSYSTLFLCVGLIYKFNRDNTKPIIADKDKPIITDKDKQLITDKDKPIITDKDKQLITDKDKPIIIDKDKPIITDKDKQLIPDKDKPIIADKDKPIIADKDKPIITDKDKPIITDKDKPIITDKDKQSIKVKQPNPNKQIKQFEPKIQVRFKDQIKLNKHLGTSDNFDSEQ